MRRSKEKHAQGVEAAPENPNAHPNAAAQANGGPAADAPGQAPGADAQAPEGSIPPDQRVATLERECEEWRDKYIRLTADFDNYRKRTLRERVDQIKYSTEEIIKALLPIVDDFERAIRSNEQSDDIQAVREGLRLIHSKTKELLREKGVQEIDALGQPLDTDLHEAITQVPAPQESLRGRVVEVVEKGYKLNDKVIRFARVVIGE